MAIAVLAAAICGVARAEATWPKPSVKAVRAAGPVTIDGALDDGAWAAAPWQGGFTSASAGPENTGAPHLIPVQTRFKVLYDDSALYVAVECDEPSPETIVARCTEHDSMVFGDDCIEVFFDPAGEGRYYHHIAINTKGAWYDDHGADYGLVHSLMWDYVIDTAARIDAAEKKWTLEARLPFGGMVLGPDATSAWVWNVTRERYAGGSTELSSWSPVKANFHQPKFFGKLTGVDVDFRRFALAVGEPKVSVAGGGSGIKNLDITTKVRNETGAARTIAASAMLLGAPATKVTAAPLALPAGGEADVSFPTLKVGGDALEANCVFAFADAGTGEVYKSMVKRLSTDYRPIAISVLRPCYRNNIYATQKLSEIVFRVALAGDMAARTATVSYALLGADGATVCEGKAKPAGLAQPLKLPAATLKIGAYRLVAFALDAFGKEVASTATAIRKLPPPPSGNEVRIDEVGNLLVNGKPFVPLGWYGAVPTEDPRPDVVALQNLQTPAVPIMPDVSSLTKPFDEHRIYSIVSVENGRLFYSFNLWRDPADTVHTEMTTLSAPSEKTVALVRQLVEAVRGLPGVVGYYIADEPEINNNRSDYLQNYYKLLCEMDPYHPVMVVNDTLDGIATHGFRNADILSPDPYSPELDYVPNFMKRCREVLRPGQTIILTPWWSSIQAHMTNDYGTAPPYPYRVFRNQCLVSLALGARGWTGYTSSFFMPEIEYRYGLPYVWRELRFLEKAMAAPPPAEALKVVADAEMTAWIRGAEGHLYLVVVNHKPGARKATISHPLLKGIDKLFVMSEGRDIAVRGGLFSDQFTEGDARIYTTDPAARKLPTTKAVEAELAQRQRDTAKPGNLLHWTRGTRALASEGYYAPWFSQYYYYAINGITDDLGWNCSHAGDKPAWLELVLKQPANIGRVVIYTPNLKDYDLQIQGPDGQTWVAQIRGNDKKIVEHDFRPAMPCLKLRVTALSAREGVRQISEIEAYEQPGDGPATPVERKAGSSAAPERLIGMAAGEPNALWSDDFTNFQHRDKYYWDGKDTAWVFDPLKHKATPKAGGGLVCTSPGEGTGMSHILPYDAAYRFFQVKIGGIEGTGYRFVNVAFSSSSGVPGYRGGINTLRPGIHTVDTHYIHDSFRKGAAKDCFVVTYMGAILCTFDWMRLVRRPEDGLAVTMADGSPLPVSVKQGDELLLQLVLAKPATDATVDVLVDAGYAPLQINGEPYVQLAKVGAKDGREWAARMKLGPGTGKFDQAKAVYPTVFRTILSGGDLRETYATACVSFE
jgi:hypothetical protein